MPQLTPTDRQNIAWVNNAIYKFLSNDMELLRDGVKEEAVSHRLGCYLRDSFEGEDKPYVVDCEYNKYGEGQGKIADGKNIRPDIIIHKRNVQSHNLIAIELKKRLSPSKWDKAKLKRLTSISSRAKYKYSLGLFIGLNRDGTKIILCFKEGQEINL